MRQVFSCLLLACLLAACAGNPPAWWNPNNRYGTAQDNASEKTVVSKAPAKTVKPVVVTEESIDPLPDSSYEEVTLTPMPDEEDENNTGLSASQNEELTPDTALPVPSVLE